MILHGLVTPQTASQLNKLAETVRMNTPEDLSQFYTQTGQLTGRVPVKVTAYDSGTGYYSWTEQSYDGSGGYVDAPNAMQGSPTVFPMKERNGYVVTTFPVYTQAWMRTATDGQTNVVWEFEAGAESVAAFSLTYSKTGGSTVTGVSTITISPSGSPLTLSGTTGTATIGINAAASGVAGYVTTVGQTFSGSKTFEDATIFNTVSGQHLYIDGGVIYAQGTGSPYAAITFATATTNISIPAKLLSGGVFIGGFGNYLELDTGTGIKAGGSTGAATYVLTADGAGGASWQAASSGSGTVTSITAGTGLSGGTITSSGTIAVLTTQNISTLSNLTTNGFVKTSGGTGALSVDTNTYLTGNQSITLSGDVSGTGTTAITATLASIVTAATCYGGNITFDAKGRITAATGKSVVILTDQQTSNTNGGTATAAGWRTRTLNTELVDTNNICTLSSNQFTLPAGTYRILARCPVFAVDRHQAKLRNVTDSTDDLIGSSTRASNAYQESGESWIFGTITIAASKTFELQHYVGTTQTSTGFGLAAQTGAVEIYSQCYIERIA